MTRGIQGSGPLLGTRANGHLFARAVQKLVFWHLTNKGKK